MKVVHLPYTYFPEPTGGTEVYVASLARELGALGISSTVAYASPRPSTQYLWEDVPVHRIGVAAPQSLDALYAVDAARTVDACTAAVEQSGADLVHFHAYTPALNGAVASALRARGVPVVFTYHTPTVGCQRGTLLRFGHTVCDGVMLVGRCSACVLQQLGVPRPIADVVARVPPALGDALGTIGLQRGPAVVPRMSGLMRARHRDTRAFLAAAGTIVAPAAWVRALLVANGVPAERILVSGQGVSDSRRPEGHARAAAAAGPVRAVILGRLDRAKGIDVVLDALALRPSLAVALDVLGSGPEGDAYADSLRALAARDSRVRLLPPVPREAVVERLADYDVVLVPSQGLETGPLVVLEAHAAGVPVIGSALAAISDRVRDGVDGRLVAPRSPAAWASALEEIVNDPTVLARWRGAIEAPRTMRDVAADMATVYERAHAARGVRQSA